MSIPLSLSPSFATIAGIKTERVIEYSIVWSKDHKTAHKAADGEKTTEKLIEEAVEFSKENFDLHVLEPYTKVSAKAEAHHPTAIKTGLFSKLPHTMQKKLDLKNKL